MNSDFPSPPESGENLFSTAEERKRFYDRLADWAPPVSHFRSFYHRELVRYHRHWIPEGADVLELGCGKGDLLAALKPGRGVGIDFSGQMISAARRNHPELEFHEMDAEDLDLDETFDYVLLTNLVGDLQDIQATFEKVREVCHPETRVILTYYNQVWEPALRLAEKIGFKTPHPLQNWLSPADLENILRLTDYDPIKTLFKIAFPLDIPFLSTFLNRTISILPGLRRLGIANFVIARPLGIENEQAEAPSVTVLIPCRNEKGNITAAIERTPDMGSHTEILFVDGNSTDGTAEEIERAMREEGAHRDIRLLHQGEGVGKGDAVRKGFAAAKGDILMILDADLTVPPEDLPKFYRALVEGKGEFINGTRLVYPMEKEAMRFLNFLGNKFFSAAFTWILEQRFRDTLCGTKVMTKKNYDRIAAGRSYFGDFDPFGDFDLIFGAAKLNLKTVEIPIRYRERTYGATNISRFRHGLLLLRMLPIAFRKLKWL